jgi:hypothetical protein
MGFACFPKSFSAPLRLCGKTGFRFFLLFSALPRLRGKIGFACFPKSFSAALRLCGEIGFCFFLPFSALPRLRGE